MKSLKYISKPIPYNPGYSRSSLIIWATPVHVSILTSTKPAGPLILPPPFCPTGLYSSQRVRVSIPFAISAKLSPVIQGRSAACNTLPLTKWKRMSFFASSLEKSSRVLPRSPNASSLGTKSPASIAPTKSQKRPRSWRSGLPQTFSVYIEAVLQLVGRIKCKQKKKSERAVSGDRIIQIHDWCAQSDIPRFLWWSCTYA